MSKLVPSQKVYNMMDGSQHAPQTSLNICFLFKSQSLHCTTTVYNILTPTNIRRGMTRAGLKSRLLGAQTQSELTITGCRWCVCPPCCLLCVCSCSFLCGMACDRLFPAPGLAQVAHCSSFLNKLLQYNLSVLALGLFQITVIGQSVIFAALVSLAEFLLSDCSTYLPTLRQVMASCWIFIVKTHRCNFNERCVQ